MRKEFKIPERYRERYERIEEFLKENPEYEYKTFLDAMELYINLKNGHERVVNCEEYKKLISSQREYSNLKPNMHDHASIRREKLIRIVNQFGTVGKDKLIRVDKQEFGVSHQTAYNDIEFLESKRVIKPAPRHEAEKYNREHRKKGMRQIKVYVTKNYEPEITNDDPDVDVMEKYMLAKPIKPSVSIEG